MLALLLLLFDVFDRMLRKAPQETLRVPWASVVVLLVACFAWFQSLPLFSIDGSSGLSPNSVQIQRWFLGYPNPKIAAMFKVDDVGMSTPPSAIDFPDRKLAISIEPLHTRAAVPAMVMAAVMIWLGAVGFKEQKWQLALMILMTFLGIVVGLLGMLDILSWNRAAIQLYRVGPRLVYSFQGTAVAAFLLSVLPHRSAYRRGLSIAPVKRITAMPTPVKARHFASCAYSKTHWLS